MRVSTSLLPNLRTERVCSFSSIRAVSAGADPRTHRLMMHAQLASEMMLVAFLPGGLRGFFDQMRLLK